MTKKHEKIANIRIENSEKWAGLFSSFNAIKDEQDLESAGDVIVFLIDFYKKATSNQVQSAQQGQFSKEEQQLIDSVTKRMPYWLLQKKGILAEAGRISKNPERLDTYDRIAAIVDNQIEINKQGDPLLQRFISASWIQDVIENQAKREKEAGISTDNVVKRLDYRAIVEWLEIENHQIDLDKHHAELGIDKNHNKKIPKLKKLANAQERANKQQATENAD